MCGITGFFSFGAGQLIDGEEFVSMTESLAHRGPNDTGYVIFNKLTKETQVADQGGGERPLNRGHVALGHKRLSILDLSPRGHQPMAAADGLVWMVYNGEVYNYMELREELKSKGYIFISTTDSEVILKSYLEWGENCFSKFNGMWAVAIFDQRTGDLILSRDRFGKKPLYYYQNSEFIIFASEIKAILLNHHVVKAVNYRKIINYAGRHYRYVDSDNESFFEGILQVPKSSYVLINSDGRWRVSSYWNLEATASPGRTGSESDLVEQFREILGDAVKIRLRSDVPVGCMLSGGMDSSSISCLAAAQKQNLITFSGVTGTGYYDESEYIQEVTDHLRVSSRSIFPGPAELFPTLLEMLRFHDEPVCTVTWYCNYTITREIARYGVPVVLTGHGGDELLAGYWDHYHYYFSDLRRQGIGDEAEFHGWLRNHGRPETEYEREKEYIRRLQRDKHLEIAKYSQYLSSLSPEMMRQAREPELDSPFPSGLSRRLYLELFYETIPPSLRAEDRNMMAFSLENRLPFLDYRLVEFCFRLDNSFKIRNGLGKWILREAMQGILPEKVRCRKDKTGFNAPADEWFRQEHRQEIWDLIEKRSFINQEIYNQEEVRKRFKEHLEGQNHYMFFWQYINLHLWYPLFFEKN
jgi:asparagine synthase (glutamine-hydrolysing)